MRPSESCANLLLSGLNSHLCHKRYGVLIGSISYSPMCRRGSGRSSGCTAIAGKPGFAIAIVVLCLSLFAECLRLEFRVLPNSRKPSATDRATQPPELAPIATPRPCRCCSQPLSAAHEQLARCLRALFLGLVVTTLGASKSSVENRKFAL